MSDLPIWLVCLITAVVTLIAIIFVACIVFLIWLRCVGPFKATLEDPSMEFMDDSGGALIKLKCIFSFREPRDGCVNFVFSKIYTKLFHPRLNDELIQINDFDPMYGPKPKAKFSITVDGSNDEDRNIVMDPHVECKGIKWDYQVTQLFSAIKPNDIPFQNPNERRQTVDEIVAYIKHKGIEDFNRYRRQAVQPPHSTEAAENHEAEVDQLLPTAGYAGDIHTPAPHADAPVNVINDDVQNEPLANLLNTSETSFSQTPEEPPTLDLYPDTNVQDDVNTLEGAASIYDPGTEQTLPKRTYAAPSDDAAGTSSAAYAPVHSSTCQDNAYSHNSPQPTSDVNPFELNSDQALHDGPPTSLSLYSAEALDYGENGSEIDLRASKT